MKKENVSLIAALCAVFMFSACGNSADTKELERLKAENEALKSEMSETTAVETVTEETTLSETTKAETETEASETTEAAPAGDGWVTYDDCNLKINGASLVTDYKGEPAVVLEMQFKNNSDEAVSCGFTFVVDVYQDGIECDTAILGSDSKEKYDTGTNFTDIKPGVEITVYEAFKLRNDLSDVVVEVSGLYDFSNEILLEHTFTM